MTVPSPTTGYLPEHHGRRRVTKPRASEDGSASSSTSSDSESEEDSVYSDSASSDDLEQLAQREWEENVRQLQLAVSVLIMPTLGKWLGRRWAYGIYARYIAAGWKWSMLMPDGWTKLFS